MRTWQFATSLFNCSRLGHHLHFVAAKVAGIVLFDVMFETLLWIGIILSRGL